MVDPEALQAHIDSLPADDFESLGGTSPRKLDYRLRGGLLADGVHLPGYQFKPEDDFGKLTFGADKPFSQNKLKEKISSSFKSREVEIDEQ